MNAELPGLPFFCGYSRSPRLSAQNRHFAVGLVLARDARRDDKLQRFIGADVQIFDARLGYQEGEPAPDIPSRMGQAVSEGRGGKRGSAAGRGPSWRCSKFHYLSHQPGRGSQAEGKFAHAGRKPLSRAIRSVTGGWVLKRFMKAWPVRGFTMNRCAVAGLASIGIAWEARESFSRALARP